jgi:hypothetical protein
MPFELAQVNVARLLAPIDDPQLREFVGALDEVNAAADSALGFCWRLQTEDGNATAVRAFEWDVDDAAGLIVNLSVWESVEALAEYVYSGLHVAVMRRRREWFTPMRDAYTALWWVPAGYRPSTDEAEDRVRHLRRHGPTPYAFTFQRRWRAPDSGVDTVVEGDNWLCPA